MACREWVDPPPWVVAEDLQHQVEVGLSPTFVEGCEALCDPGLVERALTQLGPKPRPGGVRAQHLARLLEGDPVDHSLVGALERPLPAVQHVVESVQACT